MRNRQLYFGVIISASASLAVVSFVNFPAKILYNPSASAPVGFYKIEDRSVYNIGDFVAANLPFEAEKLAIERRYLPKETPILKTIAAVADDEICIQSATVFINEFPVAEIQEEDSASRPMPIKSGCYRLQSGEYFLHSTAIKNSFDSRYFGPVVEDDVLGVATPLLIFEQKN